MKSLKRAVAVSMCAVMMASTPVLAATSSPAKISVKKAKITVKSVYTTGSTATPVVKYNGKTLKAGTDYKVTGNTKLKYGTRTITIKGIGKYTGTITKKVTVKYSIAKVKAVAAKKTYNGKKQTTKVTVKSGKTTFKKGTQYKITGVTKATNAGTYYVKVVGIGKYTGTKTIKYVINKASQKSVKVTVNSKKKKVTVKGVKAKAKVTYTTNNSKVKVKNGKITVGKGVKKGTKVTITVKVAATKNYKAYNKKVTYTVK